MLGHSGAVTFDEYERIEIAFKKLQAKEAQFQDYPCQWPWFQKYLSINKEKFPTLGRTMKVMHKYLQLARNYPLNDHNSRIPEDIRHKVYVIIERLLGFTGFFYLRTDIIEIERIASPHFYGYQPENVPNIFRAIHDLSYKLILLVSLTARTTPKPKSPMDRLELYADDTMEKLEILDEAPINSDVEELKKAIRINLGQTLKLIQTMGETLSVFGTVHHTISILMENAEAIAIEPILGQILHPNIVIDDFIENQPHEIGFVATVRIQNALRSVWKKNEALQYVLYGAMERLQQFYEIIEQSKSKYSEKNFCTILLGFHSIKFIVEEIYYNMNFKTEKFYNGLIAILSNVDDKHLESEILKAIEIDELDLSHLYVEGHNNCANIAKIVLAKVDEFYNYMHKVEKSNKKEVVDDAMENIENCFMAAIGNLVKIKLIVRRKTAPYVTIGN